MVISSSHEGKGFNEMQTVNIKFSTKLEGYKLYNNNSIFSSPIYTFPWRETELFTRQIKVQIGKSTLIIFFINEKMPTLVGHKHFCVHFIIHRQSLFHISTGKVRVRSDGNGHQSGYSRTDTKNNNINKRSKKFSIKGNY